MGLDPASPQSAPAFPQPVDRPPYFAGDCRLPQFLHLHEKIGSQSAFTTLAPNKSAVFFGLCVPHGVPSVCVKGKIGLGVCFGLRLAAILPESGIKCRSHPLQALEERDGRLEKGRTTIVSLERRVQAQQVSPRMFSAQPLPLQPRVKICCRWGFCSVAFLGQFSVLFAGVSGCPLVFQDGQAVKLFDQFGPDFS